MSTYPITELKIARVFSKTPGPRHIHEGEYSGELFRQKILEPAFTKAVRDRHLLLVDMDGAAGYGTSFLEESFGGLIREHKYTLSKVNEHLQVKSDDDPDWLEEIKTYLDEAEAERNGK